MYPFTASTKIAKAFNAAWKPSYLPVGVFVGGTSGIGQGTMEAFAHATNGNAHIIIVGRNKQKAQQILSRLPKPTSPDARHEFLRCDISSLVSVHGLSSSLPAKINFLFMSPGYLSTSLDDPAEKQRDLNTHYYGRFALLKAALLMLEKAEEQGEVAVAVSVQHGWFGRQADMDDLGMVKGYTRSNMYFQFAAYTELMLQEAAARHPRIKFLHMHPGKFIRGTSIISSMAIPLSGVLSSVLTGLGYAFSVSPTECGEFMLYGMLRSRTGFSRIKPDGEDKTDGPKPGSEEERRRMWEHSTAVVERAIN